MRKLIARRTFAQQVIAGTDSVVAGAYIPANSVFRGMRGHVTFEAAVERGLNEIAMGALSAYILPVQDPDSSVTMDAIWDLLVPKDTSADVLDLDTGVSNTQPFWEPGEVRWEEVFDVGATPVKLFEEHFLSSMGMNAIAVNRDPETTFDYEYIGGKTMPVSQGKSFRVSLPSLVVVAAGSPSTTTTSATSALAAIQEADWAQLQYIDEVMDRAYLHILGLVESGAETPWEEATNLLQRHLDPVVLEVAGGIFQPTTWNLSGLMAFDIDVQGRFPRGQAIDFGA